MKGKIIDELLIYNKWKNIEYDFSGHSNNCTLNIHVDNVVMYNEVKLYIN